MLQTNLEAYVQWADSKMLNAKKYLKIYKIVRAYE